MNDWFTWNGVNTTDYGMVVLTQPGIIAANERMSQVQIPGKSGSVTMLEGTNVYDDIALSTSCVVPNPNRIDEICAWLRGEGKVTFANRQEGFYEARITNQISFDKIVRGNPHMAFTIQFLCKPFFYLYSGLTEIEVTESPASLTNDGNIPSLPLIKLYGSGEGSIMCGSSTMLINSLDNIDYLVLDCEAKIAYTGSFDDPADPLQLLGTRVTGEWLEIPAGSSYFTFTGGITEAVITPRWRRLG